ncbi:Rv1733c family protein [Pseudonocardia terrae]|uniref:Rv1733c family protein n=1 Tax=Pseudonocardia terrae TaxID=2905831 RepID=UPI003FD73F62
MQPHRPGNSDHSDRPHPYSAVGADRIPRRATDRVESVVSWVLGVLVLVLVAVAVLTGLQLHTNGMEQARADAVDRVSVDATLLQPVDGAMGMDAASGTTQVTAPATWTAADGTPRTGAVPVLGSQPAGSTVPVWVDRSSGAIAPPPVDALQAGVTAVVGGVLVLLVGALVLLGVRALVRARCAARNHAAWAREWALYEPLWSGR